ncbi:MAG TPA: tetratricopeptide repeat protein [Gemmataceae bacterium]|jgi:tetratricopeptide (TPR) repeat protein|nr:tetratricopeptide repeat protein [Gemmataceae bacterium]
MTTPSQNAPHPRVRRLRFWGAVAAVVALLALSGFFGWNWRQDRAKLRQAMKLASADHFDAALPVLLRYHERQPQNVPVTRALALGYLYNTRQIAETKKFLDRWCELAPSDPEPYETRLSFWLMQDMVGPAIPDAEHILELKPDEFEIRRKLVQLLLSDGRHQRAKEEGLRCFKQRPKDLEIWFILANIYHGLGQSAKAADLTNQVLREAPDHLGGLKFRAKLYVEAGQPEQAIRLLKEHVVGKTSKDGTEGLYELSEALGRAGRNEEANGVLAELEWRQALGIWSKYEHRDDNPGLQERVVVAMLAAGKTDAAVRFLQDILGRNGHAPPRTHQLLADCFEKQGQADRAAEQRRSAARAQEDENAEKQRGREIK